MIKLVIVVQCNMNIRINQRKLLTRVQYVYEFYDIRLQELAPGRSIVKQIGHSDGSSLFSLAIFLSHDFRSVYHQTNSHFFVFQSGLEFQLAYRGNGRKCLPSESETKKFLKVF